MLALALPMFSFLISSHPVFLKAMLISIELLINVFLYYSLVRNKMADYLAIVISVVTSKFIYYGFKYLLIHFTLLKSGLISTPIYIQVFTTLAFGIYAYYFWLRKSKR